jgi:hypothetical protein
MYCLDWAQVDPQLGAAAAAVELEEETACGLAVGPGQEARGSSLKENIRHLQNIHTYRHHIVKHVQSHKKHLSALPYPSVNLSTHQCSSQWTIFCEILYKGLLMRTPNSVKIRQKYGELYITMQVCFDAASNTNSPKNNFLCKAQYFLMADTDMWLNNTYKTQSCVSRPGQLVTIATCYKPDVQWVEFFW